MVKNKVLHLLSSNRYSGAENVVCQIAHMFRESEQYEVIYSSPDGPIRETLQERDVTYIPMKSISICEFVRVISECKPDIIHAHDMKASFLASIVCGKIPLISHIHNNSFDSRKITIKALLYIFAAYKARHIYWVSESAQRGYVFHRWYRNKSSVLYNIIDPQTLSLKAQEAECKDVYDVVFLGRMTYPKNPQRLVEVLGMVAAEYPQFKAAIIGTGEYEDEIKNLIAEKNLQPNVDYRGFMSNPYGILQQSKLMIMTSRWEGMPMCALEAFALGVPIVSTPTDGLRELVTTGVNGYLSEEDNELVKRVIEIISDEKLRAELSRNALIKAAVILDVDRYRNELLKQYENAYRKS